MLINFSQPKKSKNTFQRTVQQQKCLTFLGTLILFLGIIVCVDIVTKIKAMNIQVAPMLNIGE